MLLDHHHHFFQGSIPGPFTQSVDGTFDLSCTVHDTGNRIGSGQSEVIMAMTGLRTALSILGT